MAQIAQYKVNQFAKDLNLKSKDILDILESKNISVKSQATLDAAQFNILFETLTASNQIQGIEDYIDGITYIPSVKKAVEKKEESAQAQANAEAMQEEYREKLSSAQATSERLVKEALARGQAREEEIIRQANLEADAIRSKAAADIALEKKKAINDAKDEISEMAMAIAGKVVGRVLSSADQESLVDHFINELGEQA